MSSFQEMREKHRKDSMKALSLSVTALTVFLFDYHYSSTVTKLLREPEGLATALEKAWPLVLLTLIPPLVSYVVGIMTIAKRDLYYSIDNYTFRRRSAVGNIISKEMVNVNDELSPDDKEKLDRLRSRIKEDTINEKIKSLFYKYIEDPDVVNPVLKEHAFIYWGDYFSALMLVFWGCLSLLVCAAVSLAQWRISTLRASVLFLLILVIGIGFAGIMGRIKRRQFGIPKTQIKEIHREASTRLLADLRKEGYFLGR